MLKRIISVSLAVLFAAVCFGCTTPVNNNTDPTAAPAEGDTVSYLNERGKTCAISLHTLNEGLLSSSEYNARYSEVNNMFAVTMAKAMANNKTCVYSPLSLQIALQILANGADEATAAKLLDSICPGLTRADVNASTARLIDTFLSAKGVNINSAFVANCGYRVSEKFANIAADYYRASVGALDFSNPNKALKEINNWVYQNTDGLISELLDHLDRETVIVILNALTLDLNWAIPFKPQSATTPFHGVSGTKDVNMISVTDKFDYGKFDEGEMVIIPYEGGEYCMAVILPKEGVAPADAAVKLIGRQNECSSTSVSLQMPRVEITSKIDVLAMASDLGISEGLKGDFSEMLNGDDFSITTIMQGAKLIVNEKGTKAAAATAIVGSKGISLLNGDVFMLCDRPYAMVIYQVETGAVLFVSTVGDAA
ncbi:MAG: serpin family protein [Clostridiales bacterium]|nr:serpin family protein [Clostridiales bacterium]